MNNGRVCSFTDIQARKRQGFISCFFVLIRKKAQYENIDADIVQGEEEPQIAEEKGDLTVHVLWCHSSATFTQKKDFNVWCNFNIFALYFDISLLFVEENMHNEEPRQDEAEHVHNEDEVCYLMIL